MPPPSGLAQVPLKKPLVKTYFGVRCRIADEERITAAAVAAGRKGRETSEPSDVVSIAPGKARLVEAHTTLAEVEVLLLAVGGGDRAIVDGDRIGRTQTDAARIWDAVHGRNARQVLIERRRLNLPQERLIAEDSIAVHRILIVEVLRQHELRKGRSAAAAERHIPRRARSLKRIALAGVFDTALRHALGRRKSELRSRLHVRVFAIGRRNLARPDLNRRINVMPGSQFQKAA